MAVVGCAGDDPPERGATEAVFLETCAPGGTPVEEEVCRCAFERIASGLDADELERLDRNLRDDPATVPPEVTEAALACAAEPLTPPTPRPSRTTTSDAETTSTTDREP